jgi:hypothetical protein
VNLRNQARRAGDEAHRCFASSQQAYQYVTTSHSAGLADWTIEVEMEVKPMTYQWKVNAIKQNKTG